MMLRLLRALFSSVSVEGKRAAPRKTVERENVSLDPQVSTAVSSRSTKKDKRPKVDKPLRETPPVSIPRVQLTQDQATALAAIEEAYEAGGIFLLTGHAGTGKTTLLQEFTRNMLGKGRRVVLSAPTHKAVSVIARKVKEAGLTDVQCRTIHSILSLKPKPNADQQVFEREKHAKPVTEEVVVIDECSMISSDLYAHILRHLPNAFVVFVGDPAQLPPIGEDKSQTFSTENVAHLSTIVRQARGNPILEAASAIRSYQGRETDLSWCRDAPFEGKFGVFVPGEAVQQWIKKAFTSSDFDLDADSFRYLAWTNQRVAEVNERIRRWRYGDDIPFPFMPGEKCLFREPLVIDGSIVFPGNHETTVQSIVRGNFSYDFKATRSCPNWTAQLSTWNLELVDTAGIERVVHMPVENADLQRILNRIKDEAGRTRLRWREFHEFRQSLAQLQSIYCMTVHRSQGSTFESVFVDLPDILKRERDNLLEAQQLQYVAVTRPSKRLIIVT